MTILFVLPGGEYEVVIQTAKDSAPCQGSSVWLTAYGDKGRSRDFELAASDDKGKERFTPNAKDKFEVRMLTVLFVLQLVTVS